MSEACSEPAGAIKAIDKHSVHQICSGQVVLTLSTAVKELVENSIDAGATNVGFLRSHPCGNIWLQRGSPQLFVCSEVTHFTSLIDLLHTPISPRHLKLPPTPCFSVLSVVTCHESSQVGTKLVFDHKGHLVQQSPHPRQQGTTVSLQQLFYTLPVRHKEFQRNIKKEYAKMIHVLQSYCVVSTGVRITCSNQNGQGKRSTVLSTSGSQSMRDNIGAIFGPKQLQSLLPFQQVSPAEHVIEEYGLKDADLPQELFYMTGFVSRGDHGVGRSATDRQFFFINNRPCDPLKVTKLVNEVYHMYNRHQYPFVALNIAVAYECVDVNVTPDKRQIFLQEEKLLLAILKTSLINMYEDGVNKISLNYTPIHRTSNVAKVANSGPTQKTLQSFFKDPVKPSPSSPLKPVSDQTKRSTVGQSALDGFRYGRRLCSGTDSEKDSALSDSDATPDIQCSGLEVGSPEVTDGVKKETLGETSENGPAVPEHPEEQTEPRTPNEDRAVSPDAKRARTEKPRCPAEHMSNTVDAPVCLQKRTVLLQFSLQELAGKVKRLQDLQKQRADDDLRYRRFRAKINPGENQSAEEELKKEISKDMFKEMEIIGQFNLGFIITKLNCDIFMIDQHASDEKYNFEMLQQHTVLQGQKLIIPQKLHLTAVSENVLLENIEIFRKNGFEFLVNEDAQVMERVKLVSLPTSKNWTFGPADIEELIFMLSDSPGVMCRPSRVRQMFASRACRKSVMIGTALSVGEMKKLLIHMGEINHPWNCPHGRPTMRHLANLDIISQD
uniref:Mismatch repair endonuclease PMS2 n=1 Tax=Cyclopterus lumpus TaxID=8103 RepID=A0A8C3G1J3_CYCLU